jgi:hypothetical protein
MVQGLLNLICEKEKLGFEKTQDYLSFLHEHSHEPSISSTRSPARLPKAAFDDVWWTLGRDRDESDDDMGMISIAVCTVGDPQGPVS